MRQLIVNADDFGIDAAVNEAIERAHREGILASASLMVTGPACDDAVARARALPSLRVGLHLVLTNGRPLLPPERTHLLRSANGEFRKNLTAAGFAYFFKPGVRKQLEDEVRAQFAAFAATHLDLDHVNAQNHMHVHPTVASIVMKVGREFGARSVRVPREPFWPSWRAARTAAPARLANAVLLAPWLALLRARMRSRGFATNDYVFGMNDSGRLTAPRVRALVKELPPGVSELYTHPATHAWPGAEPADYDFAGEFAALIDPEVKSSVARSGIRCVTYTELADSRAR